MEKLVKANVSMPIEFRYDPESELFRERLEYYKRTYLRIPVNEQSIRDEDIIRHMLDHIANTVLGYGPRHYIEGVGYVSLDGVGKDRDGYCGIDVSVYAKYTTYE